LQVAIESLMIESLDHDLGYDIYKFK